MLSFSLRRCKKKDSNDRLIKKTHYKWCNRRRFQQLNVLKLTRWLQRRKALKLSLWENDFFFSFYTHFYCLRRRGESVVGTSEFLIKTERRERYSNIKISRIAETLRISSSSYGLVWGWCVDCVTLQIGIKNKFANNANNLQIWNFLKNLILFVLNKKVTKLINIPSLTSDNEKYQRNFWKVSLTTYQVFDVNCESDDGERLEKYLTHFCERSCNLFLSFNFLFVIKKPLNDLLNYGLIVEMFP